MKPRDDYLSEPGDPFATEAEPRLRILIPLIVGCAFFMEGLDSTMIAVAIPAMALYAAFRNRVDQLAAEAAYTALHALAPVKRILVSSRPPSVVAPPVPGTR